MKPRTPPAVLSLAARFIVGAVLVYAGASKAAGASEEFALIISAYQLLPREMLLSTAALLPWAELLLGWSLLLGFHVRAAGVGAGALFGIFLVALASVKLRGIELPSCGCFGEGLHFTTAQALLVDAALAALSLLAWRLRPSPFSLDSWSQRGL